MVKSVDALRSLVAKPLHERWGPLACVLTTEVHGTEVRGFAYLPGRILRYVLNSETQRIRTTVLLRLAPSKRLPAA